MTIPLKERRDYCPYFRKRDAVVREDLKLLLAVLLAFLVVAFIHFTTEPRISHAEDRTPKKDYPLTNRGSCERLHDEGMEVEGANLQQVIDLCASNGIRL